jgi:hypothetical protein
MGGFGDLAVRIVTRYPFPVTRATLAQRTGNGQRATGNGSLVTSRVGGAR